MTGTSFINHKGKQILYNDVSGIRNVEDALAIFDKTEKIAKMQPEKSIILLTNVIDTHNNIEATNALKEFSSAVTPYIKASAVVGVSGIKRIIVQSLMRVSGRDIHLFSDIEEAKNWLVEQNDK